MYSEPNDLVLSGYTEADENLQSVYDEGYSSVVTPEESKAVLNSMKMDTSPGVDKVTVKILRKVDSETEIIAMIAIVCGINCRVPDCLKTAKTVMIPKVGSDFKELKNWRGIGIRSVFRRLISKLLGWRIKPYISLTPYQKGFTASAGLLESITRIQGALQHSEEFKQDICVAFLDMTKALDSVGHQHLSRSLDAQAMPRNLRRIIKDLFSGGSTRVCVKGGMTDEILIKRGVFQGDLISPDLWNASIDFLLHQLNTDEMKQQYGFCITTELTLLATAFADDFMLVAKNREGMGILLDKVKEGLDPIGIKLNPKKSQAIDISYRNGRKVFNTSPVVTKEGIVIDMVGRDAAVEYLGVKLRHDTRWDCDDKVLEFGEKLKKLMAYEFLHPDQKLVILKHYLWPTMNYTLGTAAPNSKVIMKLKSLESIIKLVVKDMLRLSQSCPDGILFCAAAKGGLAIPKPTVEFFCKQLIPAWYQDNHGTLFLKYFRDVRPEIREHIAAIDSTYEPEEEDFRKRRILALRLREEYRERDFQRWMGQPFCGKGVETYSENALSHRWMSRREDMKPAVWCDMIRARGNCLACKSVPGCSIPGDVYCRYGCRSADGNLVVETLGHIWGACQKVHNMVCWRHDRVVQHIAEKVQEKGKWRVLIEPKDSRKFKPDLVFLKEDKSRALIVDPTIRMEDTLIAMKEINDAKIAKYEVTAEDYRKQGFRNVSVNGLWIGARGILSNDAINILRVLEFRDDEIDFINRMVVEMSHAIYRTFVKY